MTAEPSKWMSGGTVTELPRVSVLTICRNNRETIRRCVESVLAQTYPNLEVVVQDGQSTDGTLEILRGYGDRIDLVSEKDDGAQDANLRGLRRCTGDILSMCWTDEELGPGAVMWGVENLLRRPDVAAIYGDVYSTTPKGRTMNPDLRPGGNPEWDLLRYLSWDIIPAYVGSFLWREKLVASGFFESHHCLMYDYYAKVALRWPVRYVPGLVAKFAVGGLSSTVANVYQLATDITRSVDAIMDDPETPEAVKAAERRIRAGIHLAMINTLIINADAFDDARVMLRRALQFEPETRQLTRVAWETFDYLTKKRRLAQAEELFRLIQRSGHRFPGINWGSAFALLLQHRFEEVTRAIYS
jgi:hypothetical protein